MKKYIFQSYLMGGFECSTHINPYKKRVDMVAATFHDRFAEADYERLLNVGMETARDGIRWHLIEREPFRYDFSSALNQVRAAQKTGIQIIWDLFHYGFPEDLDIFSAAFPVRFAGFAKAFIGFLQSENADASFICPMNEMSFFSWAAGEVGAFYPFQKQRGDELKRRLVRASIAAVDAIRAVCPATRFVFTDPAIHISSASNDPVQKAIAEQRRQSQFHALEMLSGKREPELGGSSEYLDIIGLNYYFNNQWRHRSGRKVLRGHKNYHPFNLIVREFHERFARPLFIAETGIEDAARREWFRYICDEVKIAEAANHPIEGICLYPICNHPGWDDARHCQNGLWDYPSETGEREIYAPLLEEINLQINAPKVKMQVQ